MTPTVAEPRLNTGQLMVVESQSEWNSIMAELTGDRVMFNYQYFRVFADEYGAEIEALYLEQGSARIFWPHLVRRLDTLGAPGRRDLISPYGFSGPIFSGITRSTLQSFLEAYEGYAARRGYVAEFIRFCPSLSNHEPLQGLERVSLRYLNDVVIVDLRGGEEKAWRRIRKTARAEIRKALSYYPTVRIRSKPSLEEIRLFLKLYYETMRRNRASAKYFFAESFIERLFKYLEGYTYLVYSLDETGRPGSAALFLVDPGRLYAYYYLAGSNYAQPVPSNRLVIWRFIQFAIRQGVHYINLGGGRGSNDSLFRFKASFSRLTKPYYIGGIVFDEDTYRALAESNPNVDLQEYSNPADLKTVDYFPLYRKGIDKTIV